MGVLFYNIFLLLFKFSAKVSSLFNLKAAKWQKGRKNIFEHLQQAIPENEKIIWMHCSSLGEFEQGRPVIEQLKILYTDYKILLTFFSPSGYEVKKDYDGADWVFYLPIDGPKNAKRFLEITHPGLVIFVKYEFWYYYLKKIKYRNIPLLLISALFLKDMAFFKWYGSLQRKMLSRFDHLFVQNESSKKLIDGIGLASICSVSGDTRFDRVIEIAEKFEPIPFIEKFIGSDKCIVAGSTWKEDEGVLSQLDISENKIKLIIAPHEITESHLDDIKKLFPLSIRLSELVTSNPQPATGNTLIIDSIGLLSRLYKYATITYVGGALKPIGVHNVLEAAVYGKPVLFGPYYNKYIEAAELVQCGGGLSFSDTASLQEKIDMLLKNENEYIKTCKVSEKYVISKKGATQKIIQFIQEKRLLTN
ncbi:MAG TPA: glycosyltransferase N-terminal domain-containing protein [Chitinophagaceae bacterium]|nr:glycosyltransferase N-terminal domain-containing protein [Chitinophagaceae bacterium]